MHSWTHAHFSPQVRSRSYRSSLSGRLPFWASPLLSRLASASGRIEFIILLIMDWSFASGCSPPRLLTTQFPSATDSQCSVRWGLPPHCWCALSGALSKPSRLVPGTPAVEEVRRDALPTGGKAGHLLVANGGPVLAALENAKRFPRRTPNAERRTFHLALRKTAMRASEALG